MPCDVADPLLPAAALALVFALSGLWARRRDWRAAGWTAFALAGLVLVAAAVLVVRAPVGCTP